MNQPLTNARAQAARTADRQSGQGEPVTTGGVSNPFADGFKARMAFVSRFSNPYGYNRISETDDLNPATRWDKGWSVAGIELASAAERAQAEPEGPLFWNDDEEHSTLYARNGSCC